MGALADFCLEEEKNDNEDICFRCGHGLEHHQHADACRFETCQCKRFE